jgi:hypothetical protein
MAQNDTRPRQASDWLSKLNSLIGPGPGRVGLK